MSELATSVEMYDLPEYEYPPETKEPRKTECSPQSWAVIIALSPHKKRS